jgi:hypothetical protein
MSKVKTYLLAPNFTFQEDGPVALGNIIADPFKPTGVLSKPDPAAPPGEIVTTTELENSYGRSRGHSMHASIFARFLQTASANIGGKKAKDVTTRYSMESMETRYFKADPAEEEVAVRCQAPRVRAAIKAGVFGDQPVYMITGIKIAKGFTLESGIESSKEATLGGSALVPPAGDFSLGAVVSGSRRKGMQDSFRSGNNIVFAYQLHVISHKGWREKRVEMDVYESKAAFLNEDGEKVDEAPMEATTVTTDDLAVLIEAEDVAVDALEAQDDDEQFLCIAYKEL